MDRQDAPPAVLELDFADGSYAFHLGLAQLSELQRACEAPLGVITARLMKGRYALRSPDADHGPAGSIGNMEEAGFDYRDVYEVIRLGLIGGGRGTVRDEAVKVDAGRAKQLVETYVFAAGYSITDGWTLAAAIAMDRLEPYRSEAPPKKTQPAQTTGTSTSPAH